MKWQPDRRLLRKWIGAMTLAAMFPASASASNPGQTNQAERVGEPVFSPRGGVYTSNVTLHLSAGGFDIRYTLDGSEPTPGSTPYKNPLTLTNSVRVRAKAFAGGNASPIVSQTYTLAESDVASFSSNVPLLILNTFGRDLSREAKAPVSARFIDTAANGRASVTGAEDFDGRGLIRFRGFTSLRYPKKSLALDIKDESDKNQKVSLLGFPKDSEWVLYAPYPDKTLLRDVLAYELSNKLGHYASRTRFIEVFLNSTSGKLSRSHYMGVYVLEEKIKRSPHRVNITPLDPQDQTEPAISGGYIFKKDHLEKVGLAEGEPPPRTQGVRVESDLVGPGGFPGDPGGFERSASPPSSQLMGPRPAAGKLVATTNGFASTKGNAFFYVEPKAEDTTPAQRAWLNHYINRLETTLYGPDFRNPSNGYAAFIDVDSFIDHHLIVEVTKNVDGFRFSTYFTKDRGDKLKMEPIWDWNLAFGNCRGKEGYVPQGWYWPQLDDYQYSWFRRFFDDPDFAQRYADRWGQLRTNLCAASNLLARVDQFAAQLQEPAARNFARWPILGEAVTPNYFVGKDYAHEIAWMKDWIVARLAWIDKQFLPVPAVALQPGGTNLLLHAPVGKIYFTLDGSDPRLDGGGVSSKARVCENPIPIAGGAQVVARVLKEKRWSSPATARLGGASLPKPKA
jgi:hypothetical protein